MQIVAIQKNIHSTPRKVRLVADMVRKMSPVRALQTLQFTNKEAAGPLSQAIKTALANAKQQNIDEKDLAFVKLEINEGLKLPRFHAGTKGRYKPYKKRWSHIKVVLSDEMQVVNDKSETKKKEIKKEEIKEEATVS